MQIIKKKRDIRKAIFSITPLGQDRLTNNKGNGIELKILNTLVEDGPQTVNEIAKSIGISDIYKIEALMESGEKMGVVTSSSRGG
jgi:predicted transcriptional regulator